MQKRGHFEIFECPRRTIYFSWWIRTCPPKRGRMV